MKTRNRKRQRWTAEDLLLQPWFLPTRTARLIKNLLPPDFRQRLRDYFDDYGCLRCRRRKVPYQSNGMCRRCAIGVFHRMYASANRRLKERLPRRYGREFVEKEYSAHKLLRGLVARARKARKPPSAKLVHLGNPIAAAFEVFNSLN